MPGPPSRFRDGGPSAGPRDQPTARTRNANPQPSESSYTSTTSALALTNFTTDDIEVIEEIIERTPRSATSFLAVLKAHSDIVRERNTDSADEERYYRFLLKLGNLRGTWGQRWDQVKRGLSGDTSDDHTHDGHDMTDATTTETDTCEHHPSQRIPIKNEKDVSNKKPSSFAPTIRRAEKTLSPTPSTSRGRSHTDASYLNRPPRRLLSTGRESNAPSYGHRRGTSSSPSRPPSYRSHPPEQQTPLPKEVAIPAQARSRLSPANFLSNHPTTPRPRTLAEFAAAAARAGNLNSSEVKKIVTPAKSPIDAEATWRALEMEKDAEDFFQDNQTRRPFMQWLNRTRKYTRKHDEASVGYDKHLAGKTLFILSAKVLSIETMKRRAENLSRYLLLRNSFAQWKIVFYEKKRRKWQADMRERLHIIRGVVEERLLQSTFLIWRDRYQVMMATKHNRLRVLQRFFYAWRQNMSRCTSLQVRADYYLATRAHASVEFVLETWRRRLRLRNCELAVVIMRDLRIREQAWMVWRHNTGMSRVAVGQRMAWQIKTALGRWRDELKRAQALERRLIRYMDRKDRNLRQGAWRVWFSEHVIRQKAKQRILQNKASVLLRWKAKMTALRLLENRGHALMSALDRSLLMTAVRVWKGAAEMGRARDQAAQMQRSGALCGRVFEDWRVALRERQEIEFSADSFGDRRMSRRALKHWIAMLRHRKRMRALDNLLRRSAKALCRSSLQTWLNRVIDCKSQQLRIQEDSRARLLMSVLDKWQEVFQRHKEEISLMDSYRHVQGEGLLRRTLMRWHAITRKRVQRREQLRQLERETALILTTNAWERWRDAFRERQLAGLEDRLRKQRRVQDLLKVVRVWESRTPKLPALKLLSYRLKLKALHRWQDAMPQRLRERQAREHDHKALITKAFIKWLENYRSKISLKSLIRSKVLPTLDSSRPRFRRPDPSKPTFARTSPLKPPPPAEEPPASQKRAVGIFSRFHSRAPSQSSTRPPAYPESVMSAPVSYALSTRSSPPRIAFSSKRRTSGLSDSDQENAFLGKLGPTSVRSSPPRRRIDITSATPRSIAPSEAPSVTGSARDRIRRELRAAAAARRRDG